MICKECKEDKARVDFPRPSGGINSGWPKSYNLMCLDCGKKHKTNNIRQAKIKYEKMNEHRTRNGQLELQDELWKKFGDLDLEADYISFTDSQEMDNMMQKYEHDLIKVLSGLEEKLPDWYGIETEEEE